MKKILFVSGLTLLSCSQTEAKNNANISKIKEEKKTITSPINPVEDEIIPGLPNHWYEIKYKNNENVIFVPCDYQNTEFIFSKKNDKIFMKVIEGQDEVELAVMSVTKIGENTMRIRVKNENMKFSYFVQKVDSNFAIWTKAETFDCESCNWENEDLDKLDYLGQKSIRMVSQYSRDKCKTVQAPPCLD